jgi:hypothetical protein
MRDLLILGLAAAAAPMWMVVGLDVGAVAAVSALVWLWRTR